MSLTPGFNKAEAMDALRLAYVVDAPVDPTQPIVSPLIPAATEVGLLNPVARPLMPTEWQAMPGIGTWRNSVSSSLLLNRCMLVRRKTAAGNWQYCLAFRGTSNLANVLEDAMSQTTVSAGPITFPTVDLLKLLGIHLLPIFSKFKPLTLPAIQSNWSYTNGALATDTRAHTALGFRMALESLDFKTRLMDKLKPLAQLIEEAIELHILPEPKQKLLQELLEAIASPSLTDMLNLIEEPNPEIIVTGHSLGAGMAQLAAAWLASGGLGGGKKPTVKLYAFAAPKPGEEYLQYSANYTLGPGMAYCVNNVIDSVPQVGLSLEVPSDLVSTGVLNILGIPSWLITALEKLKLPTPMNLAHIGAVVPLNGELPIEITGNTVIPSFYFDPKIPQPVTLATLPQLADKTPDQKAQAVKLLGAVWQHMPWIYMNFLNKLP